MCILRLGPYVFTVQGQLSDISGTWCVLCAVKGYQRAHCKEVLQALRGDMPAKRICYQKQLLFYQLL